METIQIQNITVGELREMISETLAETLTKKEEKKPTGPEYFTRAQVKDLLHVSFPTLNELTRTGKIKGYKIGGRVLYKANEIEAALISIQTKIQ